MSRQVGKLAPGKTGVEPGPKRELKFNTDKRLFSLRVDWKDAGQYLKDHYGVVREWILSVSLDGTVQSSVTLSPAEHYCEVKGLTPGKDYLVELFWKITFPAGYTGTDQNDYYSLSNQYVCTSAHHSTNVGEPILPPPDWDKPDKLWDHYMKEINALAETRLHKILVVGYTGVGKSSFFNSVLTACAYSTFSPRDTVYRVAEVKASPEHVTLKVCFHEVNLMAREKKNYLANINLVDTFGIRTDTFQGSTFEKILRGYAGDGWELSDKNVDDNPKLIKNPEEKDRCGSCIFVLAADDVENKVSVTDSYYTTLQGFIKICSAYDVNPIFLLTKVDKADPHLASSYKSVYQSEVVQILANRLHQAFGVSRDRIFPVQNYHGTGRDLLIEVGILRCLHAAVVDSDLRATLRKLPTLPKASVYPGGSKTSPEQPWACLECTLHNTSTATVCSACETKKGERKEKKEEDQKELWTCLSCLFVNEPEASACSFCRVARVIWRRPSGPGHKPPQPQPPQPQPPQPQPSPSKPWTCSCKDKKNSPTAALCGTCKKRNPEAWNCGSCQTPNGNTQSCSACQAPRPMPWTCVCTTENPLTESHCQTCERPNPAFWKCGCEALNAPKTPKCGNCDADKPKDWTCQCKRPNSGSVNVCPCGKSNPQAGKELLSAIFNPAGFGDYTDRFVAQRLASKKGLKSILDDPSKLKAKELAVAIGDRDDILEALRKSKIWGRSPGPDVITGGGGGRTETVEVKLKPETWRCYRCQEDKNKMTDLTCPRCSNDIRGWKCLKCPVENSFTVTNCVNCAAISPCHNEVVGLECFLITDGKHLAKYIHKCKAEDKCAKLGDADHLLHYSHPEIKAPPPPARPDDVKNWTVEDVASWLKSFPKFAPHVDKLSTYNGRSLLNASKDDLMAEDVPSNIAAQILGNLPQPK